MTTFSHAVRAALVFLVAFAASTALACTSIYIGDFRAFAKTQPVIVRATVASHGARLPFNADYFEEMTVTVGEVIKGDFPHDSFVFFGDTGMSCLRYITGTEFPLGSEHLFILEGSETRQPLLVAGESSVRILGDAIAGRNLFEEYTMRLDEFIELLR